MMLFWFPAPSSDRTGGKTASKTGDQAAERPKEQARETFEQLLFALVLLIVGRAFFIEPFVIPTGSMAPTLYGRHKECVCEECGFAYQIGASDEVRDNNGVSTNERVFLGKRIVKTMCPNCRVINASRRAPVFGGDHIIVNKWAYTLGAPNRWDVFVFKYPQDPADNYIKRLVGLPGESIVIRNGDLYLQTENGEQILRKDQPRKRRAMTQLVHDDAYPVPKLLEAGWPQRWDYVDANASPDVSGTDGVYSITGGQTLRYTHWVPSPKDWAAIEADRPVTPRPQLISDYCMYNSSSNEKDVRDGRLNIESGRFWVPDIGVECDVTWDDSNSVLTLELVDGFDRYRCHLDTGAQRARVTQTNVGQAPNDEQLIAEADVALSGRTRVRFSNIDDELMLWIDDRPVEFPERLLLEGGRLESHLPTQADLSPVGLAVADGAVTVKKLRVFRDVYYRVKAYSAQPGPLDDPDAYADAVERMSPGSSQQTVTANDDSYLAFGDNSPASSDSRMWLTGPNVPAHLLVGKAFWTYWPHAIPFLNDGRGIPVKYHIGDRLVNAPQGQRIVQEKLRDYPRYSLPFYPQFSRMTRIR